MIPIDLYHARTCRLGRGGSTGPTPPIRSGVILLTNPGGGSGMFGNTRSGPRYVWARRWSVSGAPPSFTRALPYTTRYSSTPRSFLVVAAPVLATTGPSERGCSARGYERRHEHRGNPNPEPGEVEPELPHRAVGRDGPSRGRHMVVASPLLVIGHDEQGPVPPGTVPECPVHVVDQPFPLGHVRSWGAGCCRPSPSSAPGMRSPGASPPRRRFGNR